MYTFVNNIYFELFPCLCDHVYFIAEGIDDIEIGQIK